MIAASIGKMEAVGVVEQAPGHETTGDDGLGNAEASNRMARGDTVEIHPLVLSGAAALHVATVVLVEPGTVFFLSFHFSLRWLQNFLLSLPNLASPFYLVTTQFRRFETNFHWKSGYVIAFFLQPSSQVKHLVEIWRYIAKED